MQSTRPPAPRQSRAALGILLGAVVLLAIWAVWTFAYGAPGWVNGLLIAGIFLLLWGIVRRGDPTPHPPHR